MNETLRRVQDSLSQAEECLVKFHPDRPHQGSSEQEPVVVGQGQGLQRDAVLT